MKRTRIVVGMSGGPDSMALAHQLLTKNYEIICAHVDYQKRESSQRDRKIVEAFALEHGLVFEVKYFDKKELGNFQANARTFRYDFFVELVHKYRADAIAIAHHLNDDVETYVFQKERNMRSETKGLAEESVYKGISVIRPLLKQTKVQILDYCRVHEIDYGLDESNESVDYTRNAIRYRLKGMTSRDYQKLYEKVIKEKEQWHNQLKGVKEVVSNWSDVIARERLLKMKDPSLYLRYWMLERGIDVSEASEHHLLEIVRVFEKGSHASYDFGAWTLSHSYGLVSLSQEDDFNMRLESMTYGQFGDISLQETGKTIEGVNLEETDFPITLRYARPEDEIVLRYGTKKLNRFFIDRKIPLYLRKKWVVVENSAKQIVFVVGIGCDVHHYANNPNLFVVK